MTRSDGVTPTSIGNCLLWALSAWWRLGGYILIRRSRGGYYPHFLWTDRRDDDVHRHIVSFVPATEAERARQVPLLLTLVFTGRMVWGDHTTGASYLRGGPRRYLLLRAAALVVIATMMLGPLLAWLFWRLAALAWRLL